MRLIGFRDAVEDRDVGMIQCGQDLGFTFEAGDEILVPGGGLRQDLDGHVTVELGIGGAVHLAHAALPDLLQQFVLADRLSRLKRRPAWEEKVLNRWACVTDGLSITLSARECFLVRRVPLGLLRFLIGPQGKNPVDLIGPQPVYRFI